MSDSQQGPWSDNPNAPKILRNEYYIEKVLFAGNFLATIPYGIVIMLFFKCMAALFDPVHRRGEPLKVQSDGLAEMEKDSPEIGF